MDKQLRKRLKALKKSEKKNGSVFYEEDEKISNRGLYDITLSNFQFHMYEMICLINGIDPALYLYSSRRTSTALNAELKLDKTFKKLSCLNWETSEEIHTRTFRGRFVTTILFKIVRNSHRIVKSIFHEMEEPSRRYKAYNVILNEWISRVDTFVAAFLTRDISYVEPLEDVIEMMLLADSKDAEMLQKLREIRNMTEKNLKGDYDDPIVMNNLFKMAFVISTGSMNVKRTPGYVEGISHTSYDSMLEQVATVGYAILLKREKGIPIFYDAFIKANPLILTKFDEVKDCPELVVGIRALMLLDIYLDSKKYTKWLDEVIQL